MIFNLLGKNGLLKLIGSIKKGLGDKVDKVNGKGLSVNDFSDFYKNKLDAFSTIKFGRAYLYGYYPEGLHGAIAFDTPFNDVPTVITSFQGDGSGTIKPTVSVYGTTKTGFQFLIQDVNNINSFNAFMNWIAIL